MSDYTNVVIDVPGYRVGESCFSCEGSGVEDDKCSCDCGQASHVVGTRPCFYCKGEKVNLPLGSLLPYIAHSIVDSSEVYARILEKSKGRVDAFSQRTVPGIAADQ